MSTSHAPFIKRLLRQQRGAITPLFLITTIGILGTTLGGIDLVRYNVVQSRLQNSLDAATLSAGRNLANLTIKPGEPKTEQWKQDAFEYFRGNMPEDYLGNDILPEDLKISYSEDPLATESYAGGQFIEMEVTGTLPLISTGFLNVSSFNVHAENRAVRRVPSDIELVMALDNTGSMASGSPSKISVLKDAAADLSKIVLAAKDESETETPREINIGLVPFADTVNVGNNEHTREWLRYPEVQSNFINNATTGWSGCIVEPPPSTWGGADLPAAVLTPDAGFQPLHLTYEHDLTRSELGLKYGDGTFQRIASPPRTPDPAFLTDAQMSALYLAPTIVNAQQYDRRVWAERVGKDKDNKDDDQVFRVYAAANPSNCVANRHTLFLTDNADDINEAIDKMEADGNTIIPTGLLWAWRMLHPDWQGAWDGTARPRATDPRTLRKVIVLLTDGQNEPAKTATSIADEKGRHYAAYKLQYEVESFAEKDYKGARTTAIEMFTPPDDSSGASGYSRLDNKERPAQGPMNSLKMRDPLSRHNADNAPPKDAKPGWGTDQVITGPLVDEYLEDLCQEVKKDDAIKIYTVTLGDVGGATEKRMNDCATGAGYFYNTQTVSDLPEVFKSIAGALTELRLTR